MSCSACVSSIQKLVLSCMKSGKEKVFCAGANIRMLAGAEHAHKVNFCKFTNETRNTYEAAQEDSGQNLDCGDQRILRRRRLRAGSGLQPHHAD